MTAGMRRRAITGFHVLVETPGTITMSEITAERPKRDTSIAEGYLHPSYADSLSEFGLPRLLPGSGGWVLERKIPGNDAASDAIGCYPLFSCRDWFKLNSDLEALEDDLVSVAIVADPFGTFEVDDLRVCFPDTCWPFKRHYVVDLSHDPNDFVHAHHRRNARKALRELEIEECTEPLSFVDDWNTLYETLTLRHRIGGIAAFSRGSFTKQLTVPGIVMFRAVVDNETVGMMLWYRQGDLAYYHLGAYSERGYEVRASFALFQHAIEEFARRGLRWLNLGAGAGAESGGSSGLSRFKEGWSTGTRTAYFCGRIFNREKYNQIVKAKNIPATNYFPAYRLGEFA